MKRIFLLSILFILFLSSVKAQDVHYNQIIPGDTTKNKNILDRLIFLAWQNNPDNMQRLDNAESFNYLEKKTSIDWLNQIAIQGNLNEFTINGTKNANLYYPRYNIGVVIPLGIFFTDHYATKAAKAQYHESLDRVNSQKMDIRQHVTNAWENYRMFHRQMTIQQQINENAYTNFIVNENKFKDGKISLQAYNTTVARYSDLLIQKIILEKQLSEAKTDLERLIGVKLEQVVADNIVDSSN